MQLHEWMSDALCRKRNNAFWYPPLDTDVPDNYYSIARELCHRCPVWSECLDAGTDEKWGMWGGLTPAERGALLDKNPKPSILKRHGSWIRYRQGCRCSACYDAHNEEVSKININVLPYWQEPVQDLEMLRFRLLSSPKSVE